MAGKCDRIIVIGTSSGGLGALKTLLPQLPADLPAALFVVQHMAADASGTIMLNALQTVCALKCRFGEHDAAIENGHIYIAPPDHHLLVKKGRMLVTKGARENRSRPSIDTLFRSAAVAYGSSVIGVILTGLLDDGSIGMAAIKQCAGIAVVQEPADAEYADMPQNAINKSAVDYRLALALMGSLLLRLVHSPAPESVAVPKNLQMEALIAERISSDLDAVNQLGSQVPYNCPDCGGVLWEVAHSKVKRYRCHVGHAFTSSVLLNAQTEKMEETLWMAMRMFEERRNLLLDLAKSGQPGNTGSYHQRSEETLVHIERIREVLLADKKAIENQVKSNGT